VGDSLIGFWLLGRRDPDDLYALSEIPILQSLANQTAIALSNILHAEQLRKMYQSGIERYENERKRLALDLHDSVLNELAVLRNDLGEEHLSPTFQTSYQEVTHHLREIVSNLRPPMLMYGLLPAINELADNLMEKSGDKIRIKVEVQEGAERISENIELHLFRIIQEACQNTLRHADAKNIKVFGILTPQEIDLHIEDDGIGFDAGSQPEMDGLLANHHFGLAGMMERAHLIAAEFGIYATRDAGTKIHITCRDNTDKQVVP
jgi:two-component system sensor histidine kinase DegS